MANHARKFIAHNKVCTPTSARICCQPELYAVLATALPATDELLAAHQSVQLSNVIEVIQGTVETVELPEKVRTYLPACTLWHTGHRPEYHKHQLPCKCCV